MKKKTLILATGLLLISSISFQSCIGSFSLTNKVLTWNRNVNNKFVNELVFFAFWVLPVYEVTAIADLLVINSIEFWSGNKPLEANNQVIDTENGRYQIYADENGYKIDTPDGNVIHFVYDSATDSWSFAKNDEDLKKFMKFHDNNHIEILKNEGEFVDIELSEEGLRNYSAIMMQPMMAME